MGPGGYTPLSETFFEAHQYLSGGSVAFGEESRLYPGTGGEFKSVAGLAHRQRHQFEDLRQPDAVQLPEDLHRLPDGRSAD